MDPLGISNLLARYKSLLRAPQGTIIDLFVKVLTEQYRISITKEEVRYVPHTRTIHLASGGPKRSEILLRREEILSHLEHTLSKRDVPKHIL